MSEAAYREATVATLERVVVAYAAANPAGYVAYISGMGADPDSRMMPLRVKGQAEQVLAMKNDNRLCHSVGSYCSKKLPVIGTCLETTQSYCCFNSRLARVLNQQGRAQLGRGWGGATSPDCAGLSLAQLQSLDFSRMDLTEFYAEIAPTLPDVGALANKARSRVNGAVGR
jgi:enamine deaminase RidA (YjgF/YER057c/UK114 family)